MESVRVFSDLRRGEITLNGIDLAVEYYNQKYPDRPPIYHIKVPSESDMIGARALGEFLDRIEVRPIKCIISTHNPHFAFNHSFPVLITDDKVILLRDMNYLPGGLQNYMSKKKLRCVRTLENKDTSIQGDGVSCWMISIGILKDIDHEDIKFLLGVGDIYIPKAKMLKYSQSIRHIEYLNLCDDKIATLDETTLYESDDKEVDPAAASTQKLKRRISICEEEDRDIYKKRAVAGYDETGLAGAVFDEPSSESESPSLIVKTRTGETLEKYINRGKKGPKLTYYDEIMEPSRIGKKCCDFIADIPATSVQLVKIEAQNLLERRRLRKLTELGASDAGGGGTASSK